MRGDAQGIGQSELFDDVMAKRVIVLTGDKQLNKKLQRLRGPEAKKIVRTAARLALKPVLDEAKSQVPVRSGALGKSLKVRAMQRSRVSFGARVTTGQQFFTGQTYYGGFIEWGTRYIAAVGFLKRSADVKRDEALRIYRQKIQFGIVQLAKRL